MSIFLLTIDSAIFKTAEQYVLKAQIGSISQQTGSLKKTVSPLFNKHCFLFKTVLPTDEIKLTVCRYMGRSLDQLGQNTPLTVGNLNLNHCSVQTRSLAICDLGGIQMGRLNITVEKTDQFDYAQTRMLSQSDKANLQTGEVQPHIDNCPCPTASQQNWNLYFDIRSAINLPLNARSDHGLPSTRVEVTWSSSIDYAQRNASQNMTTKLQHETTSPTWNESLVMREGRPGEACGFIFVTIYDDENEILDRFSFPVKFLLAFKPVNLQIGVVEGQGTLFMTCYFDLFQGLPMASLDTLVTFGVKWVDLETLPHTLQNYSLMLGRAGQLPGSRLPWFQCDSEDEQSFSRAFYQFKEKSDSIFLSPVFRFQGKQTNMMVTYNLLQSSLDEADVCLYLVGQGDSHATPLEIVGGSEVLNRVLNEALMSSSQQRAGAIETQSEMIDIRCAGGPSELCTQFMHTKCRAEVVVFPCDSEIKDFLDAKDGEPAFNRPDAINFHQTRGQMDFFDDKDRWQMLSRELAQKQELIHATMKKTKDIERQVADRGAEIVALRQGIRFCQSKVYSRSELMRQEDMIEQQVKLPDDIEDLTLGELRKQLVSTGLAYKGERIRNEEFEKKLEGAVRQLDRRDKVIAQLGQAQEDNSVFQKKLERMEREQGREHQYQSAILKQEEVIAKLEALLELSVESSQKRQDNLVELGRLDKQIAQLTHEARLVSDPDKKTQLQQEIDRLTLANASKKVKLEDGRKKLALEKQRKKEYEDWFEEKVATENQLQREQAKANFFEGEVHKNEAQFEMEIAQLNELIHRKNMELQIQTELIQPQLPERQSDHEIEFQHEVEATHEQHEQDESDGQISQRELPLERTDSAAK